MSDTEETMPLLKAAGEEERPGLVPPKQLRRLMPCLFLYGLASYSYPGILQQYLNSGLQTGYNTSTQPDNSSTTAACDFLLNASDQRRHSGEASLTTTCLINPGVSTLISAALVFYYGTLSDHYGRKLPLIICGIGLCFKLAFTCLAAGLRWSAYDMLVGTVVESLTGGRATFLMAVFSYGADISSMETRALRITFIEVLIELSRVMSTSLLTLAAESIGIFYTLLIMFGIGVLNVIYVFIGFSDDKEYSRLLKWNSFCRLLGSVPSFWSNNGNNRETRSSLICLQSCFYLCLLVVLGFISIELTFFNNRPLCWALDSSLVVIHRTVLTMSTNMGQMMSVRFGYNKLKEDGLLIMACISTVLSQILLSISRQTWMVFIATVVGFGTILTLPILKTMMSKIVDSNEQGLLFAHLAAANVLITFVSRIMAVYIYSSSKAFFTGLIFAIFGSVQLTVLVIFLCYRRRTKVSWNEQSNYKKEIEL